MLSRCLNLIIWIKRTSENQAIGSLLIQYSFPLWKLWWNPSYMLDSLVQIVQHIEHYLCTWHPSPVSWTLLCRIHKQNTFSWRILQKTYCSFHGSSIKQQSVIICLLADRQPVLVQELLCWAVFNCSNNCFIMRFHQTPLAPASWHRKWDAYLLLSTFLAPAA